MTSQTINHKIKTSITILLVVVCGAFSFSQNLSGPINAGPGGSEVYTYNSGLLVNRANWNVTNGTMINTTSKGTSYSVTIQWGAIGSGLVEFYSRANLLESLSVAVSQSQNNASTGSGLNYIHNITPRIPTTDITTLNTDEKIESITYFDGLGRPGQQVGIRAGGNSEDIITHIGYDAIGRQVKEYLPYTSTTDIGSFRLNALAATNTYYDASSYNDDFPGMTTANINPYSEKELENSPLNRVFKQAAPGKDWKLGNGHEIEMDYLTNATSEVRYYKVNLTVQTNNNVTTYNPSLVLDGYYSENELYKTITRDENHDDPSSKVHTTEEYKDKQGRVILKRTYGTSKDNNGVTQTNAPHDTYFVYDDYGNLTYVLPPKSEPQSAKPDSVELSELCYQYKYDDRNRLVEKKIPGKGWEYIVYNKLDQPILTQDANLDSQNKWLFTKYDVFKRVAYTGHIINENSRISLQNAANLVTTTHVTKQNSSNSLAGTTIYYNNSGYPTANITKIYTINYYDNYTFDKVSGNSETAYGVTPITNVKGLATGSKVRVLDTNHWITSVTYYDKKARPIYVYSHNAYLNTTDKVKSVLTFDGLATETTTEHNRSEFNKTTYVTIVDKYEYDHANRLLSHNQKINNAALDEVIAENTFDDLGQLVSKGVGGKQNVVTRLQDINYDYNVRGWLRAINNPNALGTDLFGFRINYNTRNHNGIQLFNGNIAETEWKTKNDNLLRWYIYEYDALNRITKGTASNNDYSLTDVYYDKNGNITNLVRNGHIDASAATFGVMDDLDYTYEPKSNKLKKVLENEDRTFGFKDDVDIAVEYTYDDNGNMLRDFNKSMTSNILYNHLNLPTRVFFSNGEIRYIYDALGVKLKKIVETANEAITDYSGSFIYENGFLKMISQPEGYIDVSDATVLGSNSRARPSFDYVYQYKDHLGNVRLTYADSDGNGSIDASTEIIEESNYYPFGGLHKGYNNIVSANSNSVAQKYKYNGKELQDELGLDMYDYGARMYDAWTGRWNGVDALAEVYHTDSPYTYVLNNPLSFIDPDGREVKGVTKDDAKEVHDELNTAFAGKQFDALRGLLTRGKKNNKKSFDKIDGDALKDALSGLSGDDLALAEIVTGAINSDDVHTVEFVESSDNLSQAGTDGFNATFEKLYKDNGIALPAGGFPARKGKDIVATGGSGQNFPTSDGSHSVILTGSGINHGANGSKTTTTFHEIFGHGIPSAKKSSDAVNNANAIRTENLVRRVLGVQAQRDGSGHAGGKIKNPSALPTVKN